MSSVSSWISSLSASVLTVTGSMAWALPASGAPPLTSLASGSGSVILTLPASDSVVPGGNLFAVLPPHDPWIAAGLSLGVNGLGQIYNDDWDRAWWALAPVLTYPLAWGLDTLTGSNVARTLTVVWWTGAKSWSVWDAFQRAEAQP